MTNTIKHLQNLVDRILTHYPRSWTISKTVKKEFEQYKNELEEKTDTKTFAADNAAHVFESEGVQITQGTILCHYSKTDYFVDMLQNVQIPIICINCGYTSDCDLIVFERRK